MTGRSLNRRVADLVLVSEAPVPPRQRETMSSFDIDVTRDGGWWTVHIREVNGPAQGRTIGEAEWMARQMIALATGVPIRDIAVRAAGLAAPTAAFRRLGESSRRAPAGGDEIRGLQR
jgi:hypothetical protein